MKAMKIFYDYKHVTLMQNGDFVNNLFSLIVQLIPNLFNVGKVYKAYQILKIMFDKVEQLHENNDTLAGNDHVYLKKSQQSHLASLYLETLFDVNIMQCEQLRSEGCLCTNSHRSTDVQLASLDVIQMFCEPNLLIARNDYIDDRIWEKMF